MEYSGTVGESIGVRKNSTVSAWMLLTAARFLLAALIFSAMPPVQAADSAGRTEWILLAKDQYMGRQELIISEDRVRMRNLDKGSQSFGKSVMTSGPDYKVIFYDCNAKIKYTSPMQNWNGLLTGVNGKRSGVKDHPVWRVDNASATFQGHPAIETHSELERGKQVWVWSELKIAPQVVEAICRTYNFALIDKVPLRIHELRSPQSPAAIAATKKRNSEYSLKGGEYRDYDIARDLFIVTSIKKVPYKSSDFDDVSTFKVAKRISEVAICGYNQNEVYDLVKDFAFSRDEK